MEFIKIARRRSFWSSLMHIFLNIILVATVWLSIKITKTPFIGIGLVLISKWRTFAVRPRFWLANVKSNIVDLIYSLSIVILMWSSGVDFLAIQVIFIALYVIWLVVIKPQSSDLMVKIQAILSVFVGLMALFSVGYAWPVESLVVGAALIGYSSFRHVLSVRENKNIEIMSLFWAMVVAELAWIFSFWTVGYVPFGVSNVAIPQPAIIISVLSWLMFNIADSPDTDEDNPNKRDVLVMVIFSVLLCWVLITFFSRSVKI